LADLERGCLVWQKGTACANDVRVEVAFTDGLVLVRDSKDPSGAVLSYSHPEWAAFLDYVRSGELSLH